jgi:tRNA 2-thiouridine synthesizing protein B
MSTLHIVNKSPFERNSLTSCIGHLGKDDAVLLIEDAVVAARDGSAVAPLVRDALKNGPVYVLAPDLAARAIKRDSVIAGMKLIDYHGFVELAVQHARTQSWL